jgi:hypothetical protein
LHRKFDIFEPFSLLQRGLRVTAGDAASVRCESRGGNPAAVLKWYIDDEELDEGGNGQKNETDSKKWDAISMVETTFKKVSGNIFSSRQFENKLIFTY